VNEETLRHKIRALPALGDPARFTWDFRRKNLRDKILADDPAFFLDWPVSKEALYTGWTRITKDMQQELMAQPRWAEMYDKVIRHPTFGTSLMMNTSGTTIHQAWHVEQWESFTGTRVGELDGIVEFGGGYGAMALLCHNLGFAGDYHIADFPEMQCLQDYYLSNMSDMMLVSGVDSPDLYIALFSLSEQRLNERTIPDAASYLIGYQTGWGEGEESWDNVEYFDWMRCAKPDLEWVDYPNPYFESHRVMIGYVPES